MARHSSFSSAFQCQLAREFLEGVCRNVSARAPVQPLVQSDSVVDRQVRGGELTDELAETVRFAEYDDNYRCVR
jgi:hypothetical protein